jgi:hypothetical protein
VSDYFVTLNVCTTKFTNYENSLVVRLASRMEEFTDYKIPMTFIFQRQLGIFINLLPNGAMVLNSQRESLDKTQGISQAVAC